MRKVEYLTKDGFTTSYAKAKECGAFVTTLSEVKEQKEFFNGKPLMVRVLEKGKHFK